MSTHLLDNAVAARTSDGRAVSGVSKLLSRRVILVTGKGGVGRTTTAAALARLGAARGRRVLLAEFEEPSSLRKSPLAGLFGEDVFPDEPRLVGDGVWGVTLEAVKGTELFLTSLFRIAALARLALRTAPLRRMLHAGPSFHEMGVLYHLLHNLHARAGDAWRYDLVVIDMPATGHTLALTELPRTMLRMVSRGPIARAMRAGQAIMNDPRQALACVVTLPEPLPVSECLELLEGLEATDVTVGAVLVNRVPHNPFTSEEHQALEALLKGRPVRGQTLLDRIRRAEASIARLEESIHVPVIQVEEIEDGDLVNRMVSSLDADTRRGVEEDIQDKVSAGSTSPGPTASVRPLTISAPQSVPEGAALSADTGEVPT